MRQLNSLFAFKLTGHIYLSYPATPYTLRPEP